MLFRIPEERYRPFHIKSPWFSNIGEKRKRYLECFELKARVVSLFSFRVFRAKLWSKHYTTLYLREGDLLTASPSPPSREPFLARNSSRWSSLISDPINCSKTICRIVIPTSSSNTGCKLSAVDTLDPRCGGFMYHGGVSVVDVVNSKLYVYFLVRVKYEWFELDDFTLVFCPGRDVLELVSSFLKWET